MCVCVGGRAAPEHGPQRRRQRVLSTRTVPLCPCSVHVSTVHCPPSKDWCVCVCVCPLDSATSPLGPRVVGRDTSPLCSPLHFGKFGSRLATAGVGVARARLASTLIGQMKGGERVDNAGTRGAVARALARRRAPNRTTSRTSRLAPRLHSKAQGKAQGCVSTFVARARLASTPIGQMGCGERVDNAGTRGAVARALARHLAPNRRGRLGPLD